MHFLSPSTISADGQKDITYEREAMSESICSELHFPSVWSMYIVMHTCRRIAFTFNEVLSGCERYKNAKITLQAGRPHHPFLISYISILLIKYITLTWHLKCLNRGFLSLYFSFYSSIARLLWNLGKQQVPLLTNLVSRMKASVHSQSLRWHQSTSLLSWWFSLRQTRAWWCWCCVSPLSRIPTSKDSGAGGRAADDGWVREYLKKRQEGINSVSSFVWIGLGTPELVTFLKSTVKTAYYFWMALQLFTDIETNCL